MNLRNELRVLASLILLVSGLILAGCSPAASPKNLENPSLEIALSEVNPSGDSVDIAEGLTQAEASNAPGDQASQPQVESQPFIEQPAAQAGALPESPSLKSAPPAGSQSETGAVPQPAPESSSAAAAAETGEPNIGFQAPEFSLQTVDGQPVNLSDLRGKNILLNYWVTWCIPCLEEMPVLEKLYQEYQDQNVVILSVNGINQDELDTVMATIGEFAVTFPVALDQSAVVYDAYRVQFMPTSFFIDDQGVIRYIQLGSNTEDGLRTKIEQLISDQL